MKKNPYLGIPAAEADRLFKKHMLICDIAIIIGVALFAFGLANITWLTILFSR